MQIYGKAPQRGTLVIFSPHTRPSLCCAKRGTWEKEGVHNNRASRPETTLPGPIGTTHRA